MSMLAPQTAVFSVPVLSLALFMEGVTVTVSATTLKTAVKILRKPVNVQVKHSNMYPYDMYNMYDMYLKPGFSNCLHSYTVCGNGNLNNPTDGQVSFTTTTFNSTATYNCNTGYNLQGVATRTCLANGLWSASEPTCQSKLNISIPENWLE